MAVLNGNSAQVVKFSVFEVDLIGGELRKNGVRLKLQEQPFHILAILLERAGEVVSREELRSRLWPKDTFVDFDHSLNAAVRRLRDSLGDSAETPRFVETVARRGYRFIAPINGSTQSLTPFATAPRRFRHRWPVFAGIALVLLVGTIIGWHAGLHSGVPSSIRERRLTANPLDTPILSAVLSPDGKYLAYADKTGAYLRQVDTGETHIIPLPHDLAARPAAWFPDSTHLLATWAAGPQIPASLWRVSIMGGLPRKLIDDAHDPSISPNGSQIAFLRGSAGVSEIWLMNADGGGLQKLVGQEESPLGAVAWSPDSKHIAYYQSAYHYGMKSTDNKINSVELSSRKSEVVIADSRIGPGLAWTSNGGLIYCMLEVPPNQDDSNLWRLRLEQGTARPIGSPIRITSDPGYVGSVGVSLDGKNLLMLKYDWQPDVYISDLTANNTRLSSPRRLTLDDRMDFPFSWSPDSQSVFFTSDRDGTFHVFSQNIGSPIADLRVGGPESVSGPRLSPDGSLLIYLATSRMGDAATDTRLMRVPVAGGAAELILHKPAITNQQCARAPAQLCIFSQVAPGRESFFQFDPVSGQATELMWARIDDRDPYNFNWSLSSDGQFLAVAKKQGVQKEPSIRILSTVTHSEKDIKVQAWAGISTIDWAADGKSIWATAYTTRDTWALLNVNLQGAVKTMLEEKEMRLGWAIPSPDGKHLALWKASGSANAWLVQDFQTPQ